MHLKLFLNYYQNYRLQSNEFTCAYQYWRVIRGIVFLFDDGLSL